MPWIENQSRKIKSNRYGNPLCYHKLPIAARWCCNEATFCHTQKIWFKFKRGCRVAQRVNWWTMKNSERNTQKYPGGHRLKSLFLDMTLDQVIKLLLFYWVKIFNVTSWICTTTRVTTGGVSMAWKHKILELYYLSWCHFGYLYIRKVVYTRM